MSAHLVSPLRNLWKDLSRDVAVVTFREARVPVCNTLGLYKINDDATQIEKAPAWHTVPVLCIQIFRRIQNFRLTLD